MITVKNTVSLLFPKFCTDVDETQQVQDSESAFLEVQHPKLTCPNPAPFSPIPAPFPHSIPCPIFNPYSPLLQPHFPRSSFSNPLSRITTPLPPVPTQFFLL